MHSCNTVNVKVKMLLGITISAIAKSIQKPSKFYITVCQDGYD